MGIGILAAWERLVAEVNRPWATWKRSGNLALLGGDGKRVLVLALAFEHFGRVGGVQDIPKIACTHLAFLRHLVIGTGEESHGGVAGAICEEASRNPDSAGGAGALGDHGCDPTLLHFNAIDPLLGEQSDARLGAHQVEFPLVGVSRCSLGIAIAGTFLRDHFFDDFTDVRIRLLAGFSLRPDPNFGAAIATEHRAVLHEGHFESVAGCGNSRAGSCDAATHDHQVEVAAIFGLIGQAQGCAAKRCQAR